jgi:hypothetical protein
MLFVLAQGEFRLLEARNLTQSYVWAEVNKRPSYVGYSGAFSAHELSFRVR